MKVGIAGVGGIGSNVAVHLVRAGCTSLKLVDFDRVELSNLNRQFFFADQIGSYKVDMLRENLLRIVPDAAVETARLRLTPENMLDMFRDCQLLVEGFDDQRSKKLLVETFTDFDMPIVSASGIAGREIDAIRVHRLGNCTIVGDFQTDFRVSSLYGPKISVIAAMMADFVLKTGSNNDWKERGA
ncbi:MAG: sulfur carrier protein ThiS adenylyltransferase ThiF [Desulforhopalus sp.]|nr:sulfur carrier protein ThiS adenylyltransferase ThiF [Desulforhopalus sp.]